MGIVPGNEDTVMKKTNKICILRGRLLNGGQAESKQHTHKMLDTLNNTKCYRGLKVVHEEW